MRSNQGFADSDQLFFSVVVCTYNRANLLNEAIASLCQQNLEPTEYEIIVVDNNSCDRTPDVVRGFSNRYPQIRYCFEPQQGLTHARNRGWHEAKGAYVAYVDDDCRMPKQWLNLAKDILIAISPDIFGGPYFPCYCSPKPKWFKDAYGSFELSDKPRYLSQNEYLSEGNLFIRRAIFEVVGGFDTNFGSVGDQPGYGDGAVLFKLVRSKLPNSLFYYEPKLYVYHLVRAEKMSILWLVQNRFKVGHDSFRVFREDFSVQSGQILKLLILTMLVPLLLIFNSLFGLLWRDRRQYPYWQNYIYEHTLNHFQRLGALYAEYRSVGQKLGEIWKF